MPSTLFWRYSPPLHQGVLFMRLRSMTRSLDLSEDSLRELPKIKTIPGIYAMTESSYKQRLICVPTRNVIAAYKKEWPSSEPISKVLSQPHRAYAINCMACCALPRYNPQSRQVEYGVSCAGCQVFLADVVSRLRQKWAGVARDMVYSHRMYLFHGVSKLKCYGMRVRRVRGNLKLPSFCKGVDHSNDVVPVDEVGWQIPDSSISDEMRPQPHRMMHRRRENCFRKHETTGRIFHWHYFSNNAPDCNPHFRFLLLGPINPRSLYHQRA
ncbi:uncharacterized protein CC84DRAFT_1245575 [Paraphaeosphaeria sporulosa]|uniref:Uncharacterized protein n=1 Tax=Paraphaeosphaeria sporulosa TaxID=1460663 RepID=A0A177CHT2_9PLEO|nr:uncharacterized protein CC84DRAFT_1245575 [Paraphaeosphaeria sporulosa]OAG06350.1 hypothetical protein CC84DRAFT_1245575 [Paraphaeosphaeria sporulosa]